MKTAVKSVVQRVQEADNRKDLNRILSDLEFTTRYEVLTSAINSLNQEVEFEIQAGNTDIAIFKMAQVVFLEDELHIVERVMMKGLLIR